VIAGSLVYSGQPFTTAVMAEGTRVNNRINIKLSYLGI
jgi:hypothetical protein